MNFELAITIKCPQEEVFIFLRDKDKHKQKEGSPVLLLEKTTAGSVGVGTKYREIVKMLPFYRGEIISEITRYDPPEYLEEDFFSPGMKGHLAYQFIDNNGSTKLIQQEIICFSFPLNLLNPITRKVLQRKLIGRLEEIKTIIEHKV